MNEIKKTENTSCVTVKVNDFGNGIDITKGENITNMSTAIVSYNFDFKSGILKEGCGFKVFKTPSSKDSDQTEVDLIANGFTGTIKGLKLFRHYSNTYKMQRDKLVFYSGDGYVYYTHINTEYPVIVKLNILNFTSQPKIFTSKIATLDSVIVSNETDSLGTWNGDGVPCRWENCPKIISLCDHKSKLYYLTSGDQKYIKYSENYNVTQWTDILNPNNGEGVIEISDGQGKLNKLISFSGNLYVIRDYSILKITTYEDMKTPIISTVYMSGSQIYANTVEVCGNYMLMLCRDGIIRFDGNSASKLNLKFEEMIKHINNQNAAACFHNDKYYVALKMDYNDSEQIGCESENYVNNTLLCYDTTTSSYNITRGIDIADLISLQSDCLNKIILCYNTQFDTTIGEITSDGKFFSTSSFKYWCSPLSDLGYSNKRKVIKDVSFMSTYACTITIFTESDQKKFEVDGSESLYRFPVKLTGKQVGFKIETNADKASISNLQLNIKLLDSVATL